MAISRDRLSNSLERLTLSFEDTTDTLNIWYAPNALTPERERQMQRLRNRLEARKAQRDKQRQEAIAAGKEWEEDDADDALEREEQEQTLSVLIATVRKWDLLERDPSDQEPDPPTLPVSVETLASLGWPVIMRLIREIMETLRADPTTSRTTATGSNQKALTVVSRNGSFA